MSLRAPAVTKGIGATSYLVAWVRQLYSHPLSFGYRIAEAINAEEMLKWHICQVIRKERKKKGQSFSKKSVYEECGRWLQTLKVIAPFVEARDICTLNLLRQLCGEGWMVIDVACGLSPIGLEISTNPFISCVVTDRQLAEELGAVSTSILGGSLPPNLSFMQVDARKHEQLLAAAECFPAEKIAVTCQGLLQYLYRAEKNKVANSVSRLKKGRKEIKWITPDITTKLQMQKLLETPLREASVIATKLSGRRIREHYFRNSRTVDDFLKKISSGYKQHSQLDLCQVSDLRSAGIAGISLPTIEEMIGARGFYVIDIK